LSRSLPIANAWWAQVENLHTDSNTAIDMRNLIINGVS